MSAMGWDENAEAFLKDADAMGKIASANLRLATWASELESSDIRNSALPFVREMQISGQEVTILVALSLYKSAAERIKSVFESALYYTYFRTHPSELATLLSDSDYFVSRQEIVDYHKRHSGGFMGAQASLGLVLQMDGWHRKISAIVHGQLPGAWIDPARITKIRPIKERQDALINLFVEGVELINKLLLSTVGLLLWDKISATAKKQLLSGLSGEQKKALGLDAA